MSTNRKIILANQQIYHVYNRGVERRPIFTTKREFERMIITIWFYHFAQIGIHLSQYLVLPKQEQQVFQERLLEKPQSVSILAFCLMPNHFHFILRQEMEEGVSRFVANITNSYTKYFNLKRKRVGPLFQGTFKAVWVETDDQFLHLTRYIHLNPISSFLVRPEYLEVYPWSSYSEYLSPSEMKICNSEAIHRLISLKNYHQFVYNQVDYAQKLEKIKHLILDEV